MYCLTAPRSSSSAPLPWWFSLVSDFTTLPSSQRRPGTQSAARFSAICINVPHHLSYLLRLFLSAGGTLFKAHLPTDVGLAGALRAAVALAGDTSIFVNATGLGAKTLVQDRSVYPIKGQTVLVKGEAKSATTLVDGDRYVIPRPGSGTTILGGRGEGELVRPYCPTSIDPRHTDLRPGTRV